MPYSEAQKRATIKYKEKAYEKLTLDLKKGTKEIWKAQAQKKDMTLTAYIKYLIEKDNNEQ